MEKISAKFNISNIYKKTEYANIKGQPLKNIENYEKAQSIKLNWNFKLPKLYIIQIVHDFVIAQIEEEKSNNVLKMKMT